MSGEQVRSDKGADGVECIAWLWVVRWAADGRIVPFRFGNRLTALPESFGQLTALKELYLSRASACAGWRCCYGPRTVALGDR